jgi:hypothetical protein
MGVISKDKTMNELFKAFKDMKNYPLFEIEDSEGEFHIFHINGTEEGLEAGGCANIGFLHIDKDALSVQWDECFSLDHHLQELHEACLEYIYNVGLITIN